MKIRNIFLIFLLLTFALAGCTKEDYRNCPAGLYITFTPENQKHIFADQVQNVSLYFYDAENGILAADFHYEKEDLRPFDQAAFVPQIASGTYRVVTVVNSGIYASTFVPESYSSLHMMLDNEENDYKFEDFYTAQKEITVTVNSTPVIPEEEMVLAKHNNNIHLNIVYEGYEPTPDTSLEARITGSNRRLDFAAYSCPAGNHAIYNPWDRRTNGEGLISGFSFSTMRLWHGGDVTLTLEEKATTRAAKPITINIADVLKKVTDTDGNYLYDTDDKLEFHDEYEIAVRLGKNMVLLGISIDEWDGVNDGVAM